MYWNFVVNKGVLWQEVQILLERFVYHIRWKLTHLSSVIQLRLNHRSVAVAHSHHWEMGFVLCIVTLCPFEHGSNFLLVFSIDIRLFCVSWNVYTINLR